MGSIHQVIEALRQAPSNSERGTEFEKLMVRYFELDPLLSQQYDQVCRWIDRDGRHGKTDTGIDLVARDRDTGEYTAIQCKFYEPTHTLAKSDIDSFFTAFGQEAVHQPHHHLHHRPRGTQRRGRPGGPAAPVRWSGSAHSRTAADELRLTTSCPALYAARDPTRPEMV